MTWTLIALVIFSAWMFAANALFGALSKKLGIKDDDTERRSRELRLKKWQRG